MTDRLTLTVDDYADAVQLSGGEYVSFADAPWQTPDPFSREALLIQTLRAEIADLRERLRFWRYVYLTMCVQFLVVTVAAVWGWAR